MSYEELFNTTWDEPAALPRKSTNKRKMFFWMKPGDVKELIFLNATPSRWLEHSYSLNGEYSNIMCLASIKKDCPFCKIAQRNKNVGQARKIFGFTVIDLSSWKDAAGVEHKNEKKIYKASGSVYKQLQFRHQKLVQKGASLQGARIEVTRSNTPGPDGKVKSPNVGDIFEFVESLEYSKIPDNELINISNYIVPTDEEVKELATLLDVTPVAEKKVNFD